ncbi:NAD(P)H-dependent oxidoreductase [bacterium]|nr:NAD(P)H-dependent oxidoreductase [bacterium]
MKKVIFLCGSPKGKSSSSYAIATYLSNFLNDSFEFIDVAEAQLSFNAAESEPAFERIVEKMKEASVVIWTFGAICWHAPMPLMLLFDKLFAQNHKFEGKIAASIMSGGHFLDDHILEKMEYICEQLGFGYLSDISAEGVPGGYSDYEETESSGRVLADQINRALASNYVPYRKTTYVKPDYLSPLTKNPAFKVESTNITKDNRKKILVITGKALSAGTAEASIYESIQSHSRNSVELIEIENENVNSCQLNYQCLFKVGVQCIQKDSFEKILTKMKEADGLVYIGHCSSAFVDVHLQAFISRTGSMLVMPELKGKYGFVAAVGGGPLGKDTAMYLDKLIRRYGVHSVAKLADGDNQSQDFSKSVKWAVQNLDQAMDEGWKMADRYTARSEHYFMREAAAEVGMISRRMFKYFKKNRLFDFPFLFPTTILYHLLRSEKLSDFIVSKFQKTIIQKQEKRLRRHLEEFRK